MGQTGKKTSNLPISKVNPATGKLNENVKELYHTLDDSNFGSLERKLVSYIKYCYSVIH